MASNKRVLTAKHRELSMIVGWPTLPVGRHLDHHFLDEAMETMVGGDLLKVTWLLNHPGSTPALLMASLDEFASAVL